MDDVQEHQARAELSLVTEAGDPLVNQIVGEHGAAALLSGLRAWATGRTGPVGALSQHSKPAMERCARRLGTIDPTHALAVAHQEGARFVCPDQDEWPPQLDDLGPMRPLGLWVRGEHHLERVAARSVAVIGARACTAYGAHMARLVAAGLAECAVTVISGAAFGIDAATHRATLTASGRTVTVLGCGVDVSYPSAHRDLLASIAQTGLIVSEQPPGCRPSRSTLLRRNRVLTALAGATLVIEAGARSGSLAAVRAALRLRRPVLGIPGPVTSDMSAAVHALIRNGEASLVTCAAEVLERLPPVSDGAGTN